MEKLMSLDDVEALIRRKVSTLREDIREGRLEATHVGRSVRITQKALRAFVSGQWKRKSHKGR